MVLVSFPCPFFYQRIRYTNWAQSVRYTEVLLHSLYHYAVITILNTAPGVKGLDKQFFENADILCLNETEVIDS